MAALIPLRKSLLIAVSAVAALLGTTLIRAVDPRAARPRWGRAARQQAGFRA